MPSETTTPNEYPPESSLVVRLGRAALPAKLQSTLRHFFGDTIYEKESITIGFVSSKGLHKMW